MELTRRDALVALAVAGGAAGAGVALDRWKPGKGPPQAPSAVDLDAIVTVAHVVYPAELTGVRKFVETYSLGRFSGRDEYTAGLAEALGRLDELAREWHGAAFADLDVNVAERTLREVGADTADPDPDGTDAERIRHYVVNELLYALFTSPTGGRLVGIENPQGYPGGLESYRQGPGR